MADLPFMQTLRDSFVSNQSNQFLLTGNVLDVYRATAEETQRQAEPSYLALSDYLRDRLGQRRRLVITYNIARGLEFRDDADRLVALDLFLGLFAPEDKAAGREAFDKTLAESSAYVLPNLVLLRKLYRAASLAGDRSLAIICEYFETVVPDNSLTAMRDSDRQRLVFFKEWLTDPGFVESNHLLIMISETVSAVHVALRSLPHVVQIRLPLPNHAERAAFLQQLLREHADLQLQGSADSFAALSAGMGLLGIEQTIRLARYQRGRLARSDFLAYLNRLLVSSIGDHIEIVQPAHTLADVVGNAALKAELERLRRVLATEDPDIAPVGVLVSGPNGVGKTYVLLAWAAACDRIVIMLKNLRSQFFGQTDQIFEKIRNVLEVLGNVIIIVDEADTVFAKPGGQTHETEQRLFGNIIRMMGEPRNRSRIIWVLMTARPDNLAPDFKRSGRCGLHLPVFDPEGDDRLAFLDFVLGRAGLALADFSDEERAAFLAGSEALSPADFRELQTELLSAAALAGTPLTPALALEVLAEFMPAEIGKQRRLQTLQAVIHCSRRSLLPESLRAVSKEEVYRQIAHIEHEWI